MKIATELKHKLRAEIENYGIMDAAKEMGLHYNTVSRALKSGDCTRKTFDIINGFVIKIRKELEKKTKSLINDAGA